MTGSHVVGQGKRELVPARRLDEVSQGGRVFLGYLSESMRKNLLGIKYQSRQHSEKPLRVQFVGLCSPQLLALARPTN